jgi:hypothetical protein
MLRGSDVLFIRVIGLLVVVTLVAAGSNGHPLGAPLWLPLIAFGASLHAFAGGLVQCPQLPARATFPSPRMKMALTSSSIEVCQVAMSRSSFLVFN